MKRKAFTQFLLLLPMVFLTIGCEDFDSEFDGDADTDSIELIGTRNGDAGLKGTYFDNKNFTDQVFDRVDPTINFDWGNSSPDSKIGSDTFSVRWTGFVESKYSETYTFYTVSDDGVKLWVDDQLIINDWSNHPPQERSGTISLQAGESYSIKLEYYENSGGAVAELLWSSQSQWKQVIPSEQLSHDNEGDQCPDDPNKTKPGNCGCGVPEGSCNKDEFFSIGFIPDTQRLVLGNDGKEYFIKSMEFFVENKKEINLVIVSAVGDLVDSGWKPYQWDRAKAAYDVLEDARIPYVPVHGNHDSGNDAPPPDHFAYNHNHLELMNEYFPPDKGYVSNYIGGYYEGIENAYYLFSAGGLKMMFLTLQFKPTDKEIAWGEIILRQHPDRHAIYASHTGAKQFFLSRHDNVFMSISGHIRKNRAHAIAKTTGGTIQHRFQFDFTCETQGNHKYCQKKNLDSAVVRWYTFYPKQDRICMRTYNIYQKRYLTDSNCSGSWDDTECNQYCWDYPMNAIGSTNPN